MDQLWQQFSKKHNLTEKQLKQFQRYFDMLSASNELFNITAITELKATLHHHFSDSLALMNFYPLEKARGIADVGSGGGFPGIPLKILFPELRVVLIEVTHKKVQFLRDVIEELDLDNCEIYDRDWRTFLRKTDDEIDLFCARASLQPAELIRLFKPGCYYKDATLVYWASELWQPEGEEATFIVDEKSYKVGNKRRRLIFFKNKTVL